MLIQINNINMYATTKEWNSSLLFQVNELSSHFDVFIIQCWKNARIIQKVELTKPNFCKKTILN